MGLERHALHVIRNRVVDSILHHLQFALSWHFFDLHGTDEVVVWRQSSSYGALKSRRLVAPLPSPGPWSTQPIYYRRCSSKASWTVSSSSSLPTKEVHFNGVVCKVSPGKHYQILLALSSALLPCFSPANRHHVHLYQRRPAAAKGRSLHFRAWVRWVGGWWFFDTTLDGSILTMTSFYWKWRQTFWKWRQTSGKCRAWVRWVGGRDALDGQRLSWRQTFGNDVKLLEAMSNFKNWRQNSGNDVKLLERSLGPGSCQYSWWRQTSGNDVKLLETTSEADVKLRESDVKILEKSNFQRSLLWSDIFEISIGDLTSNIWKWRQISGKWHQTSGKIECPTYGRSTRSDFSNYRLASSHQFVLTLRVGVQ